MPHAMVIRMLSALITRPNVGDGLNQASGLNTQEVLNLCLQPNLLPCTWGRAERENVTCTRSGAEAVAGINPGVLSSATLVQLLVHLMTARL